MSVCPFEVVSLDPELRRMGFRLLRGGFPFRPSCRRNASLDLYGIVGRTRVLHYWPRCTLDASKDSRAACFMLAAAVSLLSLGGHLI